MNDDVDPAPDPKRPGGEEVAYPDPAGLCRAVRRRADASQREMAERTGLSRSTIARIESGKLVPSLSVLNRLLVETDVVLVAVDRKMRDIQRARSQWEVRVAQLRAAPPPPTVEAWLRWRARQRELREARRRAGWPDQDS